MSVDCIWRSSIKCFYSEELFDQFEEGLGLTEGQTVEREEQSGWLRKRMGVFFGIEITGSMKRADPFIDGRCREGRKNKEEGSEQIEKAPYISLEAWFRRS